jgi:ABC-type Mn2+/Zn2+ transport system permease subunit
MKRLWHGIAHVAIAGVGVATVANHFVPPPYNLAIPAVQGIAHMVVALKHHKQTAAEKAKSK